MTMLGPYLLGPNDTPENGIYTGDARELSKLIPDESVDLIFTDPPYQKEFIHLYGWLAEMAAKVLKPSGFLLAMAGNFWKDIIMQDMGKHLSYFWDYQIDLREGGRNSIVWRRKTIALSKSILAYNHGDSFPRCNVVGMWSGGKQDKRYHVWGQDESSARYFVDCFSDVGSIVFDPFSGGGTTPAICKILQRPYLAFEIDTNTAQLARDRVRNTQPPLSLEFHQQGELL